MDLPNPVATSANKVFLGMGGFSFLVVFPFIVIGLPIISIWLIFIELVIFW